MPLETYHQPEYSCYPTNYPPELISVIHRACDETRKTVEFQNDTSM